MKRNIKWLLLALLFLLCGCTGGGDTGAVQIAIVEGEGYTVVNNGQWVIPGEDAVFRLEVEPGYTVADTDYAGSHSVVISDGVLELTLEAVEYPTRVHVELTRDFALVTYSPNGGVGQDTTMVYDLTDHIRPNTAIGTDLFSREGYTLTSWNTDPDGTGTRIGLGSRVTADQGGLTLYAQWEKWNSESDFSYTVGYGITITGYRGAADTIVIPEIIQGKPVTGIGYNAFQNCRAKRLILPKTITQVAQGAFQSCAFESVVLFDSIESVSDDSFRNCTDLHTVYINAIEAPYGYAWRKESCYADKVELLIQAAGRKKLVCYGGCAMWYNLDGTLMEQAFGNEYTVINLGLNGLVNSALQMQIMEEFLEPGDILFHTPELSSGSQMMLQTGMDQDDDKLWCGLENNYDLVALVEFGTVPGLLDSFCDYLQKKDKICDYTANYTDSLGRTYLDAWGSIPFERTENMEMLSDKVYLDPACIDEAAMEVLEQYYDGFRKRGVRVYVGYACVNLEAVPAEQRGNAARVDQRFREAISAMDGPVLISGLEDYLYSNSDFYDTNYHLLTKGAARNTALWIRDLQVQMALDGIWEDT